MQKIYAIFKLCDELGIENLGQLKAIKQPNKTMIDCLKEIKNKRADFVRDYKMQKTLDKMHCFADYFMCEICGKILPKWCEGNNKNTCAGCNPLDNGENLANFCNYYDM